MGDNGGSPFQGGNNGGNRPPSGSGGGNPGGNGSGNGNGNGGGDRGGGGPFDPQQTTDFFQPTATASTTFATSTSLRVTPTPTLNGIAESPIPAGDVPGNKKAALVAPIVLGVLIFILIVLSIPLIIYITKRWNIIRGRRGYLSNQISPIPPKLPPAEKSNRTSLPESFSSLIDASLTDFKLDLPSPPLAVHPLNRTDTLLSRSSSATHFADKSTPLSSSRSQRSISIYSNHSDDIFTSSYPPPMTKVPIFEEYSSLTGGQLFRKSSVRPVSYLSYDNPFGRGSWVEEGTRNLEDIKERRRSALSRSRSEGYRDSRDRMQSYKGKIRPGMGVQKRMSGPKESDEWEDGETTIHESV